MLALWLAALQTVDTADVGNRSAPVDLSVNAYRAVTWYHDPIRIAYAVIAAGVLAMIVALVVHGDAIIRE